MGEANDMELGEQAKEMVSGWEKELEGEKNPDKQRELRDKIYYMNYMKKTGKFLIETEK